jgi:hypothetical protein
MVDKLTCCSSWLARWRGKRAGKRASVCCGGGHAEVALLELSLRETHDERHRRRDLRSEDLGIHRWSSPLQGSQVVRPRRSRSGRRLDLLVRIETASNLLFDLGCKAWRSPTTGGGAPHVLDCFFIVSFRWFFI